MFVIVFHSKKRSFFFAPNKPFDRVSRFMPMIGRNHLSVSAVCVLRWNMTSRLEKRTVKLCKKFENTKQTKQQKKKLCHITATHYTRFSIWSSPVNGWNAKKINSWSWNFLEFSAAFNWNQIKLITNSKLQQIFNFLSLSLFIQSNWLGGRWSMTIQRVKSAAIVRTWRSSWAIAVEMPHAFQ